MLFLAPASFENLFDAFSIIAEPAEMGAKEVGFDCDIITGLLHTSIQQEPRREPYTSKMLFDAFL